MIQRKSEKKFVSTETDSLERHTRRRKLNQYTTLDPTKVILQIALQRSLTKNFSPGQVGGLGLLYSYAIDRIINK